MLADNASDARETYQVGRADIVDTHGSTPWPSEEDIPGFRLACESYFQVLTEKSERLRRAIAEALEAPRDFFCQPGYFDRGTWLLGAVKYDMTRASDPISGQYGIAPHQGEQEHVMKNMSKWGIRI